MINEKLKVDFNKAEEKRRERKEERKKGTIYKNKNEIQFTGCNFIL